MILKVYYSKKLKKYYPVNNWTSEIKNNTLIYFVYGKGYLKTNIKTKEYQEYKIKRIVNYLQLHRLLKKFGYSVIYNFLDEYSADLNLNYSDRIKDILFLSSCNIEKLKNIIEFEKIFQVEYLKFMDYFLRLCGIVSFDIIHFDEYIQKQSKGEYFTYNNDSISLADYITKKYGLKAKQIIDKLLK